MTKSAPDKSGIQTWLSAEYIIYWGLIWSAISLVLYLNFSVVDPSIARPGWFILTTTGLEEIGLLISGCLCLRNWKSVDISSGRAVWLLFAIAIFAFFIGNLWFCLWELLWGLDPAASAGNLFFCVILPNFDCWNETSNSRSRCPVRASAMGISHRCGCGRFDNGLLADYALS
jgi:hypothetical protein